MPDNDKHPASDVVDHVPILEEQARLDKRAVVSGRVRVKITNATEQQRLQADLHSEAVTVDRVPIGRELAPGEAPPASREEEDGKVLVIPVLEEVLVVEKRLVLREELRIRRSGSTEHVEQVVTIRRQAAVVEHLPGARDSAAD